MKLNSELLSDKPTHKWEGVLVKVFGSTKMGNSASAEIMEGEDKGKWTSVKISELEGLDGK